MRGSLLALVLGLVLTAGSASAGPDAERIFRINLVSDTDYVDPALSYYTVGWELEYATCMKLLNYPDKEAPAGSQLVPEAATGFPKVSSNGKTYTFTIRPGIKSNTGETLTAANYAAAINRDLNPKMQSPAGPFIRDIVGAEAVLDGKAATASGVKASGNRLTVTLTKAAPDFLARIAMPFFCAIPKKLGIVPEGVNSLPSWGPYFVSARTPNRSVELTKNPNYKGSRPHNVNKIVYTVGVNQDASFRQIEAGEADYVADGLSPTAYRDVGRRYGLNSGRFFVRPTMTLRFLRFNLDRDLFKDNPQLRRAVNYAIDRPELLRQYGPYAGRRTDQIIPPTMPGFRDADLYPLKGADVRTARRLARGHTRSGKAVLHTCRQTVCINTAAVIKLNLARIGLDVQVRAPHRLSFDVDCVEGFDLLLDGWQADYPDPGPLLRPSGPPPHSVWHATTPLSCADDERARRDFEEADADPRRLEALGSLDAALMKRVVPIVPLNVANLRLFVSARTRDIVVSPVYGLDLAAIEVE